MSTTIEQRLAGEEESNLVRHARRELEALGNGPEIDDHVIEMVKIFSAAGHSGYSGFYTIGLLERLLRFENLTELTDNPDEWYYHDYSLSGWKKGIYQNIRNGEAFSFDGGKTYYLTSETRRGRHVWHLTRKEKQVAIKHKPFKNKHNHEVVRAIRVTARNFIDVANWSGGLAISKVDGSGDISRQRVKVAGLIAQIGDFVVRREVGKDEAGKPVHKFVRVKDDTFEAEFASA